jgi:hypothetical protein
MKIESDMDGQVSVTITDIPNIDRLRNVDVSLKDRTINLYYDTKEEIQIPPRYDGELDDPDHPVTPLQPRAVKDAPQA